MWGPWHWLTTVVICAAAATGAFFLFDLIRDNHAADQRRYVEQTRERAEACSTFEQASPSDVALCVRFLEDL